MSLPVNILDENCVARGNSSHLSIARLKFHLPIQPYGEESAGWRVKTRFAHPGGDVDKTDARRRVVSRKLQRRFVGE